MRPCGDGHFRREGKDVIKKASSVLSHLPRLVILSAVPCREGPRQIMVVIQENGRGVTFAVRIHPRAKKVAILGEIGDALKVSLTAPPVEGRANQACVEFFAKLLKVPRSTVTIASGQTSRNKVIRVAGVSAQYVRDRLFAER